VRIMIVGATATGLLLGSYADALRDAGHQVHAVAVPEAAQHSRSPWLRLQRVPIANRVGADQLVIEANRILTAEGIRWKPDLLLTGGEDLLAGTLATIKASTACKAVLIYPDPLVNVRASTIDALPMYDLVVYACGRFGLPFFERLGAARTAFVPFGWDDRAHPRPKSDELPSPSLDVVFVGDWRPDREDWIEALGDFRVGVWGGRSWRTKTRPGSVARRSWRGGVAWGVEYARVSRQAHITLNLVDVTNGPGLNMRAFEAAGVGCFVLATWTDTLREFFVEGEHLAYFTTPHELREKIIHYLARPDERARIAANAARLAESHTYRARAAALLGLIVNLPQTLRGPVPQPTEVGASV
jgi:Glycosyl transferases group 1